MNMRVLIVLIILAINFSGFSTAAHAFTDVFCDSVSGQQVEAGSKCPDHQLTSASEKGTAGDLSGKAQCLDCINCCGGHVFSNMPSATLLVQAVAIPVTYPVLTDNIAGEYAFSLLRPPKFAA